MKKKMLFIVGILICTCLCACSAGDDVSESSGSMSLSSQEEESDPRSEGYSFVSSGDNDITMQDNKEELTASEEPAVKLSEADLASMREYAISFTEFFDTPFSSIDDLDYQMIGQNSLYWIYTEGFHSDFETDSNGYPYIPKKLLQSYVLERFGIENYEYPVSDNLNILPQYNLDKDAYLFSPAREGPKSKVSILNETHVDQTIIYIMKLETPNFETGEIMKTQNMEYTFQINFTAGGYALKAKSAKELY